MKKPVKNLFGEEPKQDWEDSWKGMPEYVTESCIPHSSIKVHFRNQEDREAFLAHVGQHRLEQHSIWYPKMERIAYSIPESAVVPPNKYPVYVISKGRWETRHTARALERLGIPYYIVIEPQEYKDYAAVIDPAKILRLPFSNLGQGSIPARNWVWEHSLKNGDKRHWILDDNIDGFYRLNKNVKMRVAEENPFIACELLSDKYSNVAISGLQYEMFAPRREALPPFYLNTRVYSCILIKNDIPYRWRGRYNEDTDLSLRVLKDGWCTILMTAFLAKKLQTMKFKGGNTDELYAGDGRLKMAESLKEQHPLHVTITKKWGRWQHQVNYRDFKKNKLIPVKK